MPDPDKTVLPTNMYGCTACPKCKGRYRYPTQHGTIICDQCEFVEEGKPDAKEGDARCNTI